MCEHVQLSCTSLADFEAPSYDHLQLQCLLQTHRKDEIEEPEDLAHSTVRLSSPTVPKSMGYCSLDVSIKLLTSSVGHLKGTQWGYVRGRKLSSSLLDLL